MTLENDFFRYVIGHDGKNLHFLDKSTGIDYCRHAGSSYCASVKQENRDYHASSVSLDSGLLKIEFGESGATAVLKTTARSTSGDLSVRANVTMISFGDQIK